MPERVVVVVPAYNESSTIRGVVESVRALGYECLVVDDGSRDGTLWEAKHGGAMIVHCSINRGVGATLTNGIDYAQRIGADIVCCLDGDGQHDPADIPKLVAALDGCDMVNGSRFLGSHSGMPWHRRLVLWLVYVAFWLVSGREISDPLSGMKCFKPETFRIRSKGFSWAAELLWRTSRTGRIKEVPISVKYTPRSLAKGQKSWQVFRVGIEFLRAIAKRDVRDSSDKPKRQKVRETCSS